MADMTLDGMRADVNPGKNSMFRLENRPGFHYDDASLGSRPMAGLMTLDHAIKVRLLASQFPYFPSVIAD
jgi:hypothetical protein